jgi:uncharacterized membrane protein SpoIIM required for sporulation
VNYAALLKLREPAWREFDARLSEARRRSRRLRYQELEDLALQYRQLLQDHALVSSRFPGTAAAQTLTRLVLEGTRWLYESREETRHRFRLFWTRKFPLAFRRLGPSLLVTVSLFALASVFGLFLALEQTSVATALLPRGAIADLERGHLWTESLVRATPPSVSSSGIATNNVSVAIIGWAGGALAGLGSLYIVLMNGFLLGALVGVTAHYSLAGRLLEFVTAHGILEITLILVTAAAGLRIGQALVEAGDRPRWEAVRAAARESLTVLAGCAPWFVPLAIVESLVSPSPDLPPALKVLAGLTLEGLFLVVAWNPFLRGTEA